MPKIPQETVERIINAADTAEVIADFIDVRRDGSAGFKACCPFHAENDPSFKISTRKNIAKCFSCGWTGSAVKFLMEYDGTRLTFPETIEYLGEKYGIPVEREENKPKRWKTVRPAQPRQTAVERTPYRLPMSWPNAYRVGQETNNTLVLWLRSLPWSEEQRLNLERALILYQVGTDRQGNTIFWQIDETAITNPQGCVRSGKIARYNADGHRWKDPERKNRGGFWWVHSTMERRHYPGFDADRYEHESCMFGLHLLHAFPATPSVCIVESEKTALMAAALYGFDRCLWLATASKSGLTAEMLQPIRTTGKRILLWPDVDGEAEWREFAAAYDYDRIDVFTASHLGIAGAKADLADAIELALFAAAMPTADAPPHTPPRMVEDSQKQASGMKSEEEPPAKQLATAEQVAKALNLEACPPALARLIDAFNLQLINVEHYEATQETTQATTPSDGDGIERDDLGYPIDSMLHRTRVPGCPF